MDTDLNEVLATLTLPLHAGKLDEDELLDEAARGENLTSDDTLDSTSEIDAMGAAAGLVVPEQKPLHGIAEVDRRDVRRWELDPASREDEPEAGG